MMMCFHLTDEDVQKCSIAISSNINGSIQCPAMIALVSNETSFLLMERARGIETME